MIDWLLVHQNDIGAILVALAALMTKGRLATIILCYYALYFYAAIHIGDPPSPGEQFNTPQAFDIYLSYVAIGAVISVSAAAYGILKGNKWAVVYGAIVFIYMIADMAQGLLVLTDYGSTGAVIHSQLQQFAVPFDVVFAWCGGRLVTNRATRFCAYTLNRWRSRLNGLLCNHGGRG